MPQHRIVIASVLKPVDDPRMYEKMALSLSQTNKYAINIIGFGSKNLPEQQGIKFHIAGQFKRLSTRRLLAPWRILKQAYRLKPSLLIITTHELLIPALLLKLALGCNVVYDVQENYWRNILYGEGFARPLRPLLAAWVRAKELCSRLYIDHYIIAEAAYKHEMPFLPAESSLLPNKYLPDAATPAIRPSLSDTKRSDLRILISGTLSSVYGTLEALSLANNVSNQHPDIEWLVVGYAPDPAYAQKIINNAANKPYIKLRGITEFVPHQEIVAAINEADIGFIPYKANKSTENCLPSRFYEYAWHQLPMIYPPNPLWRNFMESHQAGICLQEPSSTLFSALLEQLKQQDFYSNHSPEAFTWAAESHLLIHLIDELMNH